MNEIVMVCVLCGVIIYQGWVNHIQRKGYESDIRDLMNRLMAKDYGTYVQGEVVKEQVKQPQVYEEQGIPV